jgi:hypothetical protein
VRRVVILFVDRALGYGIQDPAFALDGHSCIRIAYRLIIPSDCYVRSRKSARDSRGTVVTQRTYRTDTGSGT